LRWVTVKVKLIQQTDYPWDGHVRLTVTPAQASAFEMCVRIPGWALGRPVPSDLYRFAESEAAPVQLKVNGKTIDATPGQDGYVHLKRSWKAGNVVELDMPMPVRRVYAHEEIEADRGKVALMRGPIIYCLEAVDHPGADVLKVTLPPGAELRAEHRDGLLGGVTVLQGKGLDAGHRPVPLTAVPYYAWTNREKGAMTVWISEALGKPLEQAGKSPVKVFILAGQSNMQGQGVVEMNDPRDYNGGKGNLEYVMTNSLLASRYTHLKDAKGKWTVRDDVWVRYKTPRQGLLAGGLTVGYTGYGHGSHIGPELQFGHLVGDFYDNQVLLVKTAWGGKSLFADFRPPSSGGQVGPYYAQMLTEVREALDHLRNDFPRYDGGGYKIAGFVWMQGWNDMCNPQAIPEYDKNLVNLVKDLRAEFQLPDLPVVIGELGNGGPEARGNMAAFREAQKRGAQQIDNAAFVITHDFWRDPQESPNVNHGHHWCGNAESYFLIGDALGKAMIELIEGK